MFLQEIRLLNLPNMWKKHKSLRSCKHINALYVFTDMYSPSEYNLRFAIIKVSMVSFWTKPNNINSFDIAYLLNELLIKNTKNS